MKKKYLVLLVLILVLTISSFSTTAQGVTLGDILLRPPDKIPEWGRPLKTHSPEFERHTFFIIPLASDNTTVLWLTMSYVAFSLMYPDATPPPEFSKFFKVKIKDEPVGDFGRSILSSILLTMALQQDYRIRQITDNYIILAKSIYKKEQKPSKTP